MKKVYLYDFDGTITSRDTMIALAQFRKGSIRLLLYMLCMSPLLVLMKLGRYSNTRMKERFLRHFFGGMPIYAFDELCCRFARKNIRLVRPSALKSIAQANEEGARVIIVSASADNWVVPILQQFDVEVEVVATQLEVVDGLITGRLASKNCHGQEKVERIKPLLADRAGLEIIAFGDSKGDKEMLDYADKGYYRYFD